MPRGGTDIRANFLSGSVSGGQKRGVWADIRAYNASNRGVMYLGADVLPKSGVSSSRALLGCGSSPDVRLDQMHNAADGGVV